MTLLAMLMGTAALALGIATATGLPAGPLAMLAGLALALAGIGLEEALLRDGLELAATFLVFLMVAEVELRHVRPVALAAARVGLTKMLLLVGIGLVVTVADAFETRPTLYLVLALTPASGVVILDVLRRQERFHLPVGRLAVGVALALNVLTVFGLTALAAWPRGGAAVAQALGGLAVLAAAAAGLARGGSAWVLARLRLDEEESLLFVLVALFAFLGVAHGVGAPPVAGALAAGVALARFPVSGLVRGHLASFSDFFVTVFYVSVGAVVAVPDGPTLALVAGLLCATLVLRPLLAWPALRRAGTPLRGAVELLVLLAQVGELGLVVALWGYGEGALTAGAVGAVALAVVVTQPLAVWLSADTMTGRVARRLARGWPGPTGAVPPGAVVVLGAGEVGEAAAAALAEAGVACALVEEDPDVVAALVARGLPVLHADAAEPAALRALGVEGAAALISTLRRGADNARLRAAFPGLPLWVRVFSGDQAQAMEAQGVQAVCEAALAAEQVLGWLERLGERPSG